MSRHDRHEYHRWSAPKVAVPLERRPEPKPSWTVRIVTTLLALALWVGVANIFMEVL